MILENKISYPWSVRCSMSTVNPPWCMWGEVVSPFIGCVGICGYGCFVVLAPAGVGGGWGNRGAGLNKDIDFDHSSLKE